MMKVYLALPVLNESANLPALIECLSNQSYSGFELFVCVNQPDACWYDERIAICEDNSSSMDLLRRATGFNINVIDRSSKGKGWTGKRFGVGWARKTAMDAINSKAGDNDLILSIDADTFYPEDYIASVIEKFKQFPSAIGLANPYYHRLTNDENLNKAILRYEIYMRNYNINMLLIDNPYSFTALGSAMSFPVWAYRKVGGITPHKSGEDFYFLQKLRKSGNLIRWNRATVYPSARTSDRVFFGTGPAVIKGLKNDWESYPVYHHSFFREIKEVYDNFFRIYDLDMDYPFLEFLKDHFKDPRFLDPLRENTKSPLSFSKAMFRKIDALRILQYLKQRHASGGINTLQSVMDNLAYFGITTQGLHKQLEESTDLLALDPHVLNQLRNVLFKLESKLQQKSLPQQ